MSAAAAPPPAAAPAAAPAPPASAAPKPAAPAPPSGPGAPAAAEEGGSWLDEAGEELQAMDTEGQKPRPVLKERAKPADKPKEEETPPGEETPPTGETEEVPGGEQPPEAPAQPEKPIKAAELRKAYENSQRVIKEELTPKITKLEARIKELETSDPEKSGPIAEQVKSLKTRNEGLEARMRLIAYEHSEEYQEKYFKPYVEAWERCQADLAGLKVELPDGSVRQATDIDVQRLAVLPLGELIRQSNAQFGDAADVVREHVREINRTNQAQTRALEEAKRNADNYAKTAQEQTVKQQETKAKLWQDVNTQLREKYPSFFAPVEGDSEGNKLLNSGLAMTNLLFQAGKMSADEIATLPGTFRRDLETKGRLSPENEVRLHALIRNKAANHDRLARQLKTMKAELAEAKKTLAQYEDSEPPGGGSGSTRAPSGGQHWETEPNAEIDQLDRQGK